MRRTLIVLAAVGGIAAIGVALLIDRSGSCDVLAERDLFDVIMDFDESGAKPTMEEAASAASSIVGFAPDSSKSLLTSQRSRSARTSHDPDRSMSSATPIAAIPPTAARTIRVLRMLEASSHPCRLCSH